MTRIDGRGPGDIRGVKITRSFTRYAEGSVLMEMGDTMVVCTASVDEKVPFFLRGQKKGWIAAEYSMLPRSTQVRNVREAARGGMTGRTREIQRLIGRSMRSILDLKKLGERTIWIDCDVLQADGGTRTASITGGFVALVDAISFLLLEKRIHQNPITSLMAAISTGIVQDQVLLDLSYREDSTAQVDMNYVMNSNRGIIEVQGTGEKAPFTSQQMQQMWQLASEGITTLLQIQRQVIDPQMLALIEGDVVHETHPC